MSVSLDYIQKPADGDTGATFWDLLEALFDAFDNHTHNGTNSAQLTASSFTPTTQSISSASWASQGSGTYRQTVTLPGALTFDAISIEMRTSAGVVIYPTIEKVTSTSYYVYVNDNTLNLTAVYSN